MKQNVINDVADRVTSYLVILVDISLRYFVRCLVLLLLKRYVHGVGAQFKQGDDVLTARLPLLHNRRLLVDLEHKRQTIYSILKDKIPH